MRKVDLKMNEFDKYEAIKELVDHNGNKLRAKERLGLSIRQINRLIHVYKEKGKAGFIHGNRSRTPAKKLDKSISESILLLYQNKYKDFNFSHFYDYLIDEEKINVSYTFVYTTLMKNGIRSPRARKRTKRRLAKEKLEKEKKLENKSKEEIEIIVNNEIALEDSHPRR